MQRQVTIGPEFFKKEFADYSDWHWAWVREICQNGIDAGSGKIDVWMNQDGAKTYVVVTNDGTPMTEDILVNKLLALGSSGKDFAGTVGGFGKAKTILMLCHDEWQVESGSLHASGVGGDYELRTDDPFLSGTRTTVVIDGRHLIDLESALRRFCQFAQYRGEISLNGEILTTDLSKGARRREFDFGVVYTNKSFTNRLVVRINGIPMFTQWVSLDRCVVVELSGISSDTLTSNRDGLVDPYREQLSNFTTELAVDKRSALKSKQPKYARFAGDRLSHISLDREEVKLSVVALVGSVSGGNIPESEGIDIADDEEVHGPLFHEDGRSGEPGGVRAAALAETPAVVATLGHEFVIKNETELVVPRYYRPDTDEFSNYSRKLVRIWGRLIIEFHRMYDFESEFAVGFIFDDSTEAEYENGIYGKVYYLNPAKIVEQSGSFSRSFAKRWKLTSRNQFLAIAAHEFVHGLGFEQHDENYASKLTDVMAQVMDHRKRFNWCFR